MVDGLDLITEINDLQSRLDEALSTLYKSGRELAQAEHDYKVALRQKALVLRDSGMAVGMIQLTIYGEEDVANLRFKRDVAQSLHETAQEGINILKLNLRILDAQIQREWGASNG